MLVFRNGDSSDFELEASTISAALSWKASENWDLAVTAGAVLNGQARANFATANLGPGPVLGVAGTWHGIREDGATPWLDLTVGFTITHVGLDFNDDRMTTADIRLSCAVGYTLWNVWKPYLAGRFFNGPVLWHGDEFRFGSDRFFTQVAIGSVFQIPGGVSLFVEYADLMERKVAGGLAVTF